MNCGISEFRSLVYSQPIKEQEQGEAIQAHDELKTKPYKEEEWRTFLCAPAYNSRLVFFFIFALANGKYL